MLLARDTLLSDKCASFLRMNHEACPSSLNCGSFSLSCLDTILLLDVLTFLAAGNEESKFKSEIQSDSHTAQRTHRPEKKPALSSVRPFPTL